MWGTLMRWQVGRIWTKGHFNVHLISVEVWCWGREESHGSDQREEEGQWIGHRVTSGHFSHTVSTKKVNYCQTNCTIPRSLWAQVHLVFHVYKARYHTKHAIVPLHVSSIKKRKDNIIEKVKIRLSWSCRVLTSRCHTNIDLFKWPN